MEAVELEQIGTSIRSAMGDTAGQFRQAAARSNEEIGKVVKDISRMFKAQREELNEIGNTLQESIHQSESESAKMDRLAGIFEESVQIQSDMLSELKKTSAGMKYIGDNIIRLNDNIMSSGPNGLLGSLTGLNSSFSTLASALLGAGVGAVGGAMLAGGGSAGGADAHTPVKTSGSFAQHQQEAYTAARSELSDKGAKILVANLSGESLKNPGDVHPDPSKSNPFQKAHGIASWSDVRSEKIKNQFGKYPQQMSVEEQTKALMWEMKKDYPRAWEALKNENLSDKERLWAVVKQFENPAHPEKDTETRMGYLAGLKVSESSTPIADAVSSAASSVKQKASDFMQSEGRGTTTPIADQPSQAEKVPSADAPRTEPIGGEHGHGPISGAKEHGEKMGASEAKKFLQSRQGGGGFVGVNAEKLDPAFAEKMAEAIKKAEAATGTRAVITEGYRPPEVQAQYYANYVQRPISWEGKVYNPQKQGGIAAPPGRSKHQRGLAVDLSDNAARDWLVAHAGELGLGRVRGDAPHFQSSGGVSEEAAAQTPYQTAGQQVTTSGESIPSTPGSTVSTSQATPVAQEPAVSGPSMGGMNPMAMMGMMGGMMPGGMGGIVGMVAPMLMSALGSIQAPEAAAATLETAPSTNVPAEMIQALSKSADNTKMLTQAAINKQVQQESAQDPITEMLNSVFGQQQNTPEVQGAPTMAGSYDGYNGPSDIGWPDWAEMIGGNHWKEMKSYKKNMWG